MSGHSKWAGIKHKKAIADAKKGKIFTKIIREILVATKESGPQIENNARLRKAIEDAKEANMPMDNIKKAIQGGTGELFGSSGIIYEEMVYEGYGPAGVALIVEVTTDNKNRTISDIRKIFVKYNGNLAEIGCVGWMFARKGYITISKFSVKDEEIIMNTVLEAGAEDFKNEADSDVYEIITSPSVFEDVKNNLKKKISISSAEVTMIPKIYVSLSGDDAIRMLNLIDALEEYDNVKNVYSNFYISRKEIEKLRV
ncbi:MAG: YebC/PmpR family DNA-binding transcriptional regulator [Endomicrobium sp.]|jgi:YebC/PmpR family DNA-binding regulatory protein|nr:YebC/PmpR family DNA-binding transcriptional regulator [Endomicrobium sp.]